MFTAAFFSLIALVAALTADAFAAGLAYGAEKIKIPFKSMTVIAVICSALLGASLTAGGALTAILPDKLPKLLSFGILLTLALFKLFSSIGKLIVKWLKSFSCEKKPVKLTLFNVSFLLCVCEDFKAADRDLSHTLSLGEAASLSVALSLDGIAAGIGAGLSSANPITAVILSVILTFCAVFFGSHLGGFAAKHTKLDISLIGGVILLILAISKLI